MRRALLLLGIALISVVACNREERPSGPIAFSPARVELSAAGGICEVSYTQQDAMEGVNILVVSQVAWVTDIDTSKRGTLRMRILGNPEAAERTTTLEVRYPGWTTPQTLEVVQRGVEQPRLTLNFEDADYSSCTVSITPDSEDLYYIVMMAQQDYFAQMDIVDAASLTAADNAYFLGYMPEADSLRDFMVRTKAVVQGTTTKSWEGLSPADSYVVYAYGVELYDDRFERVTPVYHLTLEDRMPVREAMSFDVTITAEGPEVTFDITPEAWEGYYMVQLVADDEPGYISKGDPLDETFEEAVAESFFYVADNMYYFYEKSAEEIMSELGYRGHATFSRTLNAEHKYMTIIYAIASDEGGVPMMVSKPTVKYFSTGSVAMSDMTFDVRVENIKPRSADITIIPSTNEESYTAVLIYADNLPEGSNDEQLRYIIERYPPMSMQGIYSERVEELTPDTDFLLAVYGFHADAPTTQLFLHRFTTAEDGVGDNAIVAVSWCGYDLYEVIDIEEYYNSMAGIGDYFLSVDITTKYPTERVYFDIIPLSRVEEYGEKYIREMLFEGSYHSLFDWAICMYGNEYVVCGLAEDEHGYVGELFISEPISYTPDTVGDAAEFVDKYKEYSSK